jgi:[DsrC]-trisulfide reductase subunit M
MGVSLLTIVMSLLAYGAMAIFIVAFFSRVIKYAKTPSPLKIPTTPAPLTPIGVIGRMFLDVVFFRSLFKGNKWTWIGGMVFHYSFLLVVLRHMRYFFYPEPAWVMDVQAIGIYAGFVLPIAVLYLTMRRTTVDRTMFVSSLADYFILALVFCIAGTGIIMNYYDRPFIVDIKGFVYGLVTLNPSNIPLDPVFIVHLLLVMTLLVYFPFSKLMHMGGLFFSPTRFMTDNPREKRHVNPWSPNLSS